MRISSVMLSIALFGCGAAPQSAAVRSPTAQDGGIPVLAQQTCPTGHDCDILEVVDIHTQATSEDKGFDELRARAAQRGGDAVVGAEFEHGEGSEPSHLSGMAVRFLDN